MISTNMIQFDEIRAHLVQIEKEVLSSNQKALTIKRKNNGLNIKK